MANAWTDDEIAFLRKAHLDELSADTIARQMGRSRGSVIGKLDRMGLVGKAPGRPAHAPRHMAPMPAPQPLAPALAPFAARFQPLPDLPQAMAQCTLDELQPKQCRWPHGDPRSASFRFCGQSQLQGSSYCDSHHQLAYGGQRSGGWMPNKRMPYGTSHR